MCIKHFGEYGVGLRTGLGQKLVVRPVPVVETEPGVFEQPDTGEAAFKAWMKKVNASVMCSVGLSVHDLPDACYRDWFENGVSPEDAASHIVAEAMDEMGFDW